LQSLKVRKQLIKHQHSLNISNSLIEYPKRGWMSEIFSPSKVWLQVEDQELLKLCEDIDQYYKANHESTYLEISENDLRIGGKIAAFICGKWNRATILSNKTQKENICSKYKGINKSL